MRVLFLHTANNGLTAEYKVHTTLAMTETRGKLESYFIWQSPFDVTKAGSVQSNSIHFLDHDFGRNMSLVPKPNHYHRAGMIISRFPKTLVFLISKTKQIKPDVIYTSQQFYDILWARLLTSIFHIPHVIHLHYNIGPWLGKFTLNTIRNSSRLIAVSEYVRQSALFQGVLPSKIHTVVNPIPSSPMSITTSNNIRTEFNLEIKARVIVAVGRLDPGKGHFPLLEAFARVVTVIPEARLLLCGASFTGNNYDFMIKRRVIELELSQYVVFAGHRNDVPAILRASDLFCLPTELDAFPLAFLEAMEAGIPVVAYYSGGVPEIVIQNQTGLLSYPNDIDSLTENIIRVLSDSELAIRLGKAGRTRVLTEFDPVRVVDRWLKVLNEIV